MSQLVLQVQRTAQLFKLFNTILFNMNYLFK